MHPNRKYFLLLMTALCVSACLKPFSPEIGADDAIKYVVYGQLTGVEGFQKVTVSRTSPLASPAFLPVKGCKVQILDNENQVYELEEVKPGEYQVWMDSASQSAGKEFRVIVKKENTIHITSGFDKMPVTEGLDSLYYEIETRSVPQNGKEQTGLQFYLDFHAPDSFCRNFRWIVTETWEYHAEYPLEWYYDGRVRHVVPPDESRRICWYTRCLPDIFTLSTHMLSENRYRRYPLFWASHGTGRFKIRYSLLVEQFGLSNAAYAYWEDLRRNMGQEGGLYEKQPLAVKGNLTDMLNPEQDVLGFFAATSLKTKRIFLKNIQGLMPDTSTSCSEMLIMGGFEVFSPADFPVYLKGDEYGFQMTELSPSCVDCTRDGGTTQKPDFWPDAK